MGEWIRTVNTLFSHSGPSLCHLSSQHQTKWPLSFTCNSQRVNSPGLPLRSPLFLLPIPPTTIEASALQALHCEVYCSPFPIHYEFAALKIQVSLTIRKQSIPMKTFMNWNGVKWRSDCLRVHEINGDKAQELADRHFRALSVVLEKELGITSLTAQGARCLYNSSCKTHTECYFCLFPSFITVKISPDFLRLGRY